MLVLTIEFDFGKSALLSSSEIFCKLPLWMTKQLQKSALVPHDGVLQIIWANLMGGINALPDAIFREDSFDPI